MASYSIAPPEPFDFSRSEDWPKWIRRFERFRQASNLCSKSDVSQVNTLIYSMGDLADDILRSFGLSAEQQTYDAVKKKFEDHFVKRRNVIFERARFNQRRQEDGETAASFITALYSLVEYCGYRELRDEMIWDRIVVGIRDRALSEKLQLDPDLTLDRAVNAVRQSKAVKQQQSTVRSRNEDSTVGVIKRDGRRGQPPQKPWKGSSQKGSLCNAPGGSLLQQKRRSSGPSWTHETQVCSRCGKSPPHSRAQYPAKDVICHQCSKKGHFKSMCRSQSIVEDISGDELAFLGAVSTKERGQPWTVSLYLNDCLKEFKIDTGADVTVIPVSAYDQIRDGPLLTSTRVLRGPAQQACTQGAWSVQGEAEKRRHRSRRGDLCGARFAQGTSRQASN